MKTMTKKEFEKAAYTSKGEVRGDGPRCATCGDLAAWGTHPACDRERGKLLLSLADDDE